MTPQQLTTWVSVGLSLVQAGIATAGQVHGLILLMRGPAMSEEELNAILQAISDDARRRELLAQQDREQAQRDAEAGRPG